MRKFLFLVSALTLSASAALAQAGAWQVGQHVQIGPNRQGGTIIAILIPQMANGGALIKVHLDSMGPGFPDVGVSYDTVTAQVTPTAAAAPAVPATAAPAAPVAQPGPVPAAAPTQIP